VQALYNHTGSLYDMSNRCVFRWDWLVLPLCACVYRYCIIVFWVFFVLVLLTLLFIFVVHISASDCLEDCVRNDL